MKRSSRAADSDPNAGMLPLSSFSKAELRTAWNVTKAYLRNFEATLLPEHRQGVVDCTKFLFEELSAQIFAPSQRVSGVPKAAKLRGRRFKPGSDEERAAILQAVQDSGGNMSNAAKRLGVARATLYRRMARIGFELKTEVVSTRPDVPDPGVVAPELGRR